MSEEYFKSILVKEKKEKFTDIFIARFRLVTSVKFYLHSIFNNGHYHNIFIEQDRGNDGSSLE